METKPKKSFNYTPKWLKHFDNSNLTLQLSQFHYFSSTIEGYRPITLYNLGRPVKMHIEVDNSIHDRTYKPKKTIDESAIKDFGYLNFLQAADQQEIIISPQSLSKQSQWVRKYEPTKFVNLLTDQRNNRIMLSWLKSWDPIVFNKQTNAKMLSQSRKTPNFFNNYNNFKKKQISNINPQNIPNNDIDHHKLILLAGPPGCGKTTLARVIANHCKYQYAEINASDDRTANALISKIANMAENQTIRQSKKPTLIILDEVDGAIDGESNGLKAVINYIETGQLPKEVGVSAKKQGKKKKSKNFIEEMKQQGENALYIKRPIIFICNDPYVKGLKELRSKAKIVYFNQLQTERVVKRLKQVCEQEKIYVQNQVLIKICELCSNDIRSSLGVLQLACRMKQTLQINPKQLLSRLRFSLNKDSQQSINELIWEVLHKKIQTQNPQSFFQEMEHRIMKMDKQSLLVETFFCNLHRSKNNKSFGVNFGRMSEMYESLIYCDFIFKKGFDYNGELDRYLSLPFCLYQLYFKTDDNDRIEFPRAFIDNLNRQKANQTIMDQLYEKMHPKVLSLINRRKFKNQDLQTLFLCIQPSSLRDQDIVKCLSLMITYGLEFSASTPPNPSKKVKHIYKPEIQNLFTYTNAANSCTYLLSNSTKTQMERSYDYVKSNLQIFNHPQFEDQQQRLMVNKLSLSTSRKRKMNATGKIKYKFEEGSGTQIKCTLKLRYFL